MSSLCATQQEAEPAFFQASPDPIIPRSQPGSWDYAYNDPGAVLAHDGLLHMFNNGFDGWPSTSGIGHYVSDDGLRWKAKSRQPVFRSAEQDFDGFALVASSAMVTAEGQWRLYVTQLKASAGQGVRGIHVRLLLADDPDGTWTLTPQSLLEPGPEGSWDQHQISDPMVLSTEEGYVMYYSGFDSARVARIGMARSKDGLEWAKHAAAGGPLVGPSLDWELGVHYPSVVRTKNGFGMLYRAPTQGGSVRLGRAFSSDGLLWSKGQTPVFAPDGIEGNSTVNISALVQYKETYFLYLDGFVGGQFSLPYVLTPEGDLFGAVD